MCGIVGFAHRDRQFAVSRPLVRAMCDAIQHRGPDDEGISINGSVGLGMRRLSIIDLAAGHQPISNETGSITIVFNGEIYNYRDLRSDLCRRGHVFKTASDTETILHLYEDHGAECVSRLRGMFAFAIHDARDGSLFLARDRFGIKPLYVAEGPRHIAFSSELKALVAAGLTSRALDWGALDAYIELGYIPAPLSPFTDVRKLEPGFWLRWHPEQGTIQRRYWDLPTRTDEVPPNVAHRVQEWLDDSVRAHLISDVPVAAFLSGGIDSSAVVSSMAITSGAPPHAFTARYRGSGADAADETALAARLANRFGARLTVVDVQPNVNEVLEPIIRTLDEPHADESAIPSWHVSKAIASEYKVALAGTGGDELFAGYRRHIGLLVGEQYHRLPRQFQRAISAAAGALREPVNGSGAVDRFKRFARSNEGPIWKRYLQYHSSLTRRTCNSLYSHALRGEIETSTAEGLFGAMHARGGELSGLRAGLYLDYKTYLPDDILALSDRIAMAHSLEVRVPFVDHELVERVFPLPDRAKVGLGRAKQLLRAAVRDRLPAEHFRAPKRGFVGPMASWLRHELREMLGDELSSDRIRRLGLFAPTTVSGFLTDHFSRRHDRSRILWELLCFSTWYRLTIEDSTTPARSVA